MTKALIAKIHIAKKQLGLDDDTYRQLLSTATGGKTSCAQMATYELQNVLDTFKAKGFKAKKNNRRLSPQSGKAKVEQIDKIRAIWITMAKHDFVRDGSEDTLNAYTKRMTTKMNKGQGVDAVAWLNQSLAAKVLEALKQWHKRELIKWFNAHDLSSFSEWCYTTEKKITVTVKSQPYKTLVELFEEMRMRVPN